jgi:AcrR family transcriptional regulator
VEHRVNAKVASKVAPKVEARMSSIDRRAQLLTLASLMLSEGGLESLTMEALAVKAGIGKPVVYRLFENRDALLVALFEAQVVRIGVAVDRAIASCGNDLECIIAKSARAYFASSLRADDSLRQALEGAATTGALGAARRAAADAAARRWAQRFIEHGLRAHDSIGLSLFLLGGLARLNDSVARGHLSRGQAERIYIASAIAALRAVIYGKGASGSGSATP